MIPLSHLERTLAKERRRIRKDGDTEFLKGMAHGLTSAILIARKLFEQVKGQRVPNPMGLKRAK